MKNLIEILEGTLCEGIFDVDDYKSSISFTEFIEMIYHRIDGKDPEKKAAPLGSFNIDEPLTTLYDWLEDAGEVISKWPKEGLVLMVYERGITIMSFEGNPHECKPFIEVFKTMNAGRPNEWAGWINSLTRTGKQIPPRYKVVKVAVKLNKKSEELVRKLNDKHFA